MMRFSVVVPNLHSPIVDRTLESLRSQDFPGLYEVIVVGQDRYGLVREDSLVRSISTQQPLTPGIARNIGIKASQGEIIAFIDSDCIAVPDWLSRLEKHFQDPKVMAVGGGVKFPDNNFWTLTDNLSSFYEYLVTSPEGERLQLPSLNLSIRRTCLDTVGLFDEKYHLIAGEDADLTTRIRMSCFSLLFDPKAAVEHLHTRRSSLSVFKHAYTFGKYSIKVDPRYRAFLHTPFFLQHWVLITIAAPFLAAGVVLKMLRNPFFWRYFYALPVIFLIKIAWCIGAAVSLRRKIFPLDEA